MNDIFNYIFKVTSNASGVTSGMDKLSATVIKVEENTQKMDLAFSEAFNHAKKSIGTIKLDAILNQVDRVATGLDTLNKPGMDLSTSMFDLQAITGVTGQKLKEIEGYARQNAKTFGGSASAGVESYKLILSQLNPEIGKVPVALKEMGNSVSTTSKLMGGDTAAATEVLTTAMNQYQVSTADPIQASKEMAIMMNVMAAAAQEGSAELPQIKQALEQAGMAAKAANVSFAESNAAIQVLDKAGKKGSEGGVALRNVMATLSEGRFLPKDVKKELSSAGVDINTLGDKSLSLADRLKPLRKIMGDSALVTKLFGKENSNAALALISGIDEQERLTNAITGTNTAYEQAAIVMESPAEKNARLTAKINDFKISLFNATDGLIGYASVLGSVASDIGNLVPLMTGAAKVVSTLASKQKMLAIWTGIVSAATTVWTGVQWLLNAAFWANPLTWIIAAIIALIGVIAWVVSSTEGWGEAWKHTVNGAKLLFKAYVETVKLYFNTMVNGIMIGINHIKKGWYEFKEDMGIGESSENQKIIAQINRDTEARKKAIIDGAKNVIDLAKQSKDEFVLAAQSIKWKKGAEKTEEGISPAGLPGMKDGQQTKSFGSVDGKKSKTNEAIATGGTKHNYITINLGNLIGAQTIQVRDLKEGTNKMSEQTQDALLRLLASAATSAE